MSARQSTHLQRDDSPLGQAAHRVRVPHFRILFVFFRRAVRIGLCLVHQALGVRYDTSKVAAGKVKVLHFRFERGRWSREGSSDERAGEDVGFLGIVAPVGQHCMKQGIVGALHLYDVM